MYSIVSHSTKHLSADEVLVAARRQDDGIARATVYNNLNALTKQGLIRRVQLLGQPDRYDRVMKPHDHLICDRCGAISDISFGDVLGNLSKESGLALTGYELNAHYICDNCRRQSRH